MEILGAERAGNRLKMRKLRERERDSESVSVNPT